MPRVFISYKHDVEPDVRLAAAAQERLKQAGNDVFIDSQIKVGDEWPTVIEQQVKASDSLVVFLSSAAAASEMIIKEVEIARRITGSSRAIRVRPGVCWSGRRKLRSRSRRRLACQV